MIRNACLLALALQAGCGMSEIRATGCIQLVAESDQPSDLHLYKAGQPVPGDNLATATADDPEAHHEAHVARRDGKLALALGAIGIVFTVVGVSVTADGGHGESTPELAVGVPLAAIGVGSIIAAAIELHKSSKHGQRAVDVYDQHHPQCR